MASSMYDTPSFSGYSLWVVPPPGSKEEEFLCSLIRAIAEEDPAALAAGCPVFSPHLTLLAGLPSGLSEAGVISAVEEVLQDLPSAGFELRFSSVEARPQYFQCVLAVADKEPALMAANNALQSAFGLSYSYFPHLSLAYGENSKLPMSERERIAEKADEQLRAAASSPSPSPAVLHFRSPFVEVWRTEGTVSDWVKLASLKTGSTSGTPSSV